MNLGRSNICDTPKSCDKEEMDTEDVIVRSGRILELPNLPDVM